MIGSRVVAEAQRRGHAVTAVVRALEKAPAEAAAVRVADVLVQSELVAALEDHAAVVSAVGGAASGRPDVVVTAARVLLAAMPVAGVSRLVVVGGAGSLLRADGTRVVDGDDFPDAWKPASLAQCDALEVYRRAGDDVDWTYISPAEEIAPGERLGRYSIGADDVIADDAGRSRISAEDYAAAVVDAVGSGEHLRRRIAVAYT